jgi:hypothetical protein
MSPEISVPFLKQTIELGLGHLAACDAAVEDDDEACFYEHMEALTRTCMVIDYVLLFVTKHYFPTAADANWHDA